MITSVFLEIWGSPSSLNYPKTKLRTTPVGIKACKYTLGVVIELES